LGHVWLHINSAGVHWGLLLEVVEILLDGWAVGGLVKEFLSLECVEELLLGVGGEIGEHLHFGIY